MSNNREIRRILVVDDNDAIHADFRKILSPATPNASRLAGAKAALFGDAPPTPLQRPQFEVDSALQGQEGLQKLELALKEQRPYCVAFVDMRMPPGWDGVQTIQRLWQVDPDLQVVICTAYSDQSWEEISTKLGLSDRLLILKKPFDPVEVAQLATALSEKWMLRRAARLKMDELEQMVENRTRELAYVALHDRLTTLPNRSMLHERLDAAVEKAKSDPKFVYAVMFLDFDRFKMVNDSLGHDVGDCLLKGIADRIQEWLRLAGQSAGVNDAMAARLGGDEFVVLIEGVCDPITVAGLANGLLGLLSTDYYIAGRTVHSTVSIGITTSELQYTSADDVLRDADTAMYHAKATGKARYVLFDRTMHETVKTRLEIENDLRHALEEQQFFLHYQPIISLASGQVEGFEALLRWNHPRKGVVQPTEFIACAEEIGLIVPIGEWVLRESARQLQSWRHKFPGLSHMRMSVNVSNKQIAEHSFVKRIGQIMQEEGVDPSSIVLEITESAMTSDMPAAQGTLQRLRALGVSVQVDDFGTGYSSLSCLHQFALDGLKIDRSFIQNVSERRDYAAVVHAIVSLARNLGMHLVAEGIETAEQIALLQAMDCDLAQGFYFSPPCSPADAEAFLEKRLSRPLAA